MLDTNDRDGQRVGSVLRAFTLIAEMEASGPVTVSELAESVDMPVSSVCVYLQTLLDTELQDRGCN